MKTRAPLHATFVHTLFGKGTTLGRDNSTLSAPPLAVSVQFAVGTFHSNACQS